MAGRLGQSQKHAPAHAEQKEDDARHLEHLGDYLPPGLEKPTHHLVARDEHRGLIEEGNGRRHGQDGKGCRQPHEPVVERRKIDTPEVQLPQRCVLGVGGRREDT